MGQNSKNSKRVMQKTKMNEMNALVNPLRHFPPKNKSFSTKLFNGKIIIERERVS